jgi:CubicO group peptidase (beta-lactamase class C family)
MIIQKATGQPGHQEIEDRILRPLGLDQTLWMGTSPTLRRPHAHARARSSLGFSRLYFHLAQRIRWRSTRLPIGVTALG